MRRQAPVTGSGTVALCIALLACAPRHSPQVPERGSEVVGPDRSVTQAKPVPDLASIAGQWDVVSFEGYQPQRLSGTVRAAFADFRHDGVSLRIECNFSGRAGTVRNGRFVRSRGHDSPQTLMGCEAERAARDQRYFSFFTRNPTVERLDRDGLRLRAEGSELILERPAVRRLRFVPRPAELRGEWRMMELAYYQAERGYSGIGWAQAPGRIMISGDRILYSRCPRYGVTFRLGDGGKLEKTGWADLPPTLSDCGEVSGAVAAPESQALWDAVRLLHANPLVEKTDQDSLLLSTERHGLLIKKVPRRSVEQSGVS